MECSNGTARSVRFTTFERDHQRRAKMALDDTCSGNPNDAAMPAVSLDHDAIGITQRGLLFETTFNSIQDFALRILALAIELVEAASDFARLRSVFRSKQVDHATSDIHPPSC